MQTNLYSNYLFTCMYVYIEFDIKMLSLYRIRRIVYVSTKGAAVPKGRERERGRQREEEEKSATEAGRAGERLLF